MENSENPDRQNQVKAQEHEPSIIGPQQWLRSASLLMQYDQAFIWELYNLSKIKITSISTATITYYVELSNVGTKRVDSLCLPSNHSEESMYLFSFHQTFPVPSGNTWFFSSNTGTVMSLIRLCRCKGWSKCHAHIMSYIFLYFTLTSSKQHYFRVLWYNITSL